MEYAPARAVQYLAPRKGTWNQRFCRTCADNDGAMTDFLFAVPQVIYGIARVVDLGGYFDAYNKSATPRIADERAAKCDWKAVSDDIASAVCLVTGERGTQE